MGNKILFLPHCLNDDSALKIKPFAERKGYDVYVLPGGSMMKKILGKYSLNEIEKIVGVACEEEIGLARDYFSKTSLNGKIISIQLSENGCRDTKVNIGKLFSEL